MCVCVSVGGGGGVRVLHLMSSPPCVTIINIFLNSKQYNTHPDHSHRPVRTGRPTGHNCVLIVPC